MADKKEIFNILEEADGEGAGLSKRQVGDAVNSANEAPVLPAEDSSGNMQHIPLRDEGDAVSGVDAQPGLVAKDESGDFAYIPIVNGAIPVDSTPGTSKHATGNVTVAALTTDTTIATITLTASKSYEEVSGEGYSTQPCFWKIVQKDDATETTLAQGLSGSGSFEWSTRLGCISFSSGATGVQELKLVVQQLRGPLTDCMGQICANER